MIRILPTLIPKGLSETWVSSVAFLLPVQGVRVPFPTQAPGTQPPARTSLENPTNLREVVLPLDQAQRIPGHACDMSTAPCCLRDPPAPRGASPHSHSHPSAARLSGGAGRSDIGAQPPGCGGEGWCQMTRQAPVSPDRCGARPPADSLSGRCSRAQPWGESLPAPQTQRRNSSFLFF